ncbi:unnamed protein product [Paramecium pentaurelia]|uniref:Phospholipid/glycerol acyltransferase domain-containing protein n=1 Tax=Paramecium pentaurelia TaxID=43138 RepID=A0A8S1T802_9CILI|nr:unnamed protein product [Paramecium pentaurelia]
MFSVLVTIFHLLTALLSIIYVNKGLKRFNSFLYKNADIPEKYTPFRRTDRDNWNRYEMYICSIILFPFRLLLSFAILIFFIMTMFVATFGFKLKNPWPESRLKAFKPLLQTLAKAYLYANGFIFIKEKTLRFEDFIPDYKRTELSKGQPSIIISNHSSWYDTITYVYKYLPSFMSKVTVSKYPLFGWITTSLKSIYVDRESEESRHKCVTDLAERVTQINQGQLFPPVIIFPEGTTTNGECLIPFKRGAFDPLLPVKICCLKYSKRRFHPVMDVIGIGYMTLFALNQLANEVEIIEFEGLFDPTYLNLQKYPQEKRWEVYADACRDVMAKALGINLIEATYRDGMEYQKKYVTGKLKQE